jgi:pimeloyl-ACP methyl ester carboxylesterase
MPVFECAPGVQMHYVTDDYTDPWRKPETVLMLHGNCESGQAWYGWVPHLARDCRIVRPDMRGFGASTPMPADYKWPMDEVIGDFIRLMDHLKVERFHLVTAKIGGVIGRAFAARQARRVQTLTIVGSPPPLRLDRDTREQRVKEVETEGIERWARRSMGARLGSDFPREGAEWWLQFMSRTALSTEIGFTGTINFSDISKDVPRIACPTLVITTEGSGHASVEETQAWVKQIPNASLMVLPGDSFHAAATAPDRCAEATREFIARHGGKS